MANQVQRRSRLSIRLQANDPRPTLPQVSQPALPQLPSNTFVGTQAASTSPDGLTMAVVPEVPPIHGPGVSQEPVSYFESFGLDLLAATSPLPHIELTTSDSYLLSDPFGPGNPYHANGPNAISITSNTPRDRNNLCVRCFWPRPPGSNTQEDEGLCRACYAKLRRARLRAARQSRGQVSRD